MYIVLYLITKGIHRVRFIEFCIVFYCSRLEIKQLLHSGFLSIMHNDINSLNWLDQLTDANLCPSQSLRIGQRKSNTHQQDQWGLLMKGPLTTMTFSILTYSNTVWPLRSGTGANSSSMPFFIFHQMSSLTLFLQLSVLPFLSFCWHGSLFTLQWRKNYESGTVLEL